MPPRIKEKKGVFAIRLIWGMLFLLVWGWVSAPLLASENQSRREKAEWGRDLMPIRWEDAYQKWITAAEGTRLEGGEILVAIQAKDGPSLVAQTMGLIKAPPEDCFRVVSDYNQYRRIMPYTMESRVLRSFLLEGAYPGREAVDFWTRIQILGFSTRYLIRIAHLVELEHQRFRTFWTLVDRPEEIPVCRDQKNRPCENDLEVNMGSHLFEPYPGNPRYTVHTYTLRIGAKDWLRRSAIHWDKGNSMKEVTRALRRVLEK